MRAFPAIASAPAALALLAAAGLAHALPPEPASAPKGAHVAVGPPPAAVASAPTGPTAGLSPGNSTDPIDITSEGVEVIQPQRLTIFRGNVEETQGTQRLRTPELRVYYKAKQPTPGQPAQASGSPFGADQTGGIDHIEAAGPVYYITPTENARGDAMTYYKDTNIITLTGHVILVQGKDVAKGDKLVMNRNTGQNNLISDSPTTAAGRVRVILYPQQQQPAPGAPAAPAKPSH
jgi:lipopolysaccharide export system protein LptA